MPVAQTRGHAGKAIVIAGVSVVLLLGLAFLVATLAERGDVEVRLGDERFDAGQVENISKAIADEGGLPLLFQDLVGGGRNLFVQHRGTDPDQGWTAFGAFVPEDPDCLVELDREARELVSTCDPDDTFPLDGSGLRFYPTSVVDERLLVDINELSTTTTPP